MKQNPGGPFPGRSWNRRDQPPSAATEKDPNKMSWKEFVKKHPCPFPGRSWQRKDDLDQVVLAKEGDPPVVQLVSATVSGPKHHGFDSH